MKKHAIILTTIALLVGCVGTFKTDTPEASAMFDENEIRLYANPLAYEVVRSGKTVVAKTPIDLKMDGVSVADAKLRDVSTKPLSGSVATPVYKKASVDLSGTETFADFGDFGIRLVARADGVAYRFETKNAATIDDERAGLTIPSASAKCWYHRTKEFGWEEALPEIAEAKELKTDPAFYFYLPFVYSVDGQIVAVTDSDVRDYPVWNFQKVEKTAEGVRLDSAFAPYPKKTIRIKNWNALEPQIVEAGGRKMPIVEYEPHLVKAAATRTLPWRAFILADKLEQLCENDLVFALAEPQAKGSDFSWVKPGKVAWEWWNAFDNRGRGQVSTEVYVRFIDFAAKNGVEYVIMDEGWSETLNIWKFHKDVDVPFLIDYAKKKGVDIILWMAWAQVYGEEERVAAHFAKLGAKGFKVDFVDRGDADIATFLEKFAAACAKHKMLVDYHGIYRPVGLHRTYPNIINYEGIHGLENLKWGEKDKDMTRNDVACFFTRMTAGPMDYTPGAMKNYKIGDYRGDYRVPGSVGTRAHQMALMALYEAPLQMLCDSPTNYEQNMECFSFMAKVPTVWDATVGLPGTPETVAAVARQAKDGAWYAAAIANKDARDYTLDTAFLGSGEWTAEIFRDAPESDELPEKYVHETKTVKAGDALTFRLASGGGFIVRFSNASPKVSTSKQNHVSKR